MHRFPRYWPRFWPRSHWHVPLHWVLIVPFVVQTVGIVGLVGYWSYRSGEKAVGTLADQLMLGVSNRVTDQLDDHLQTAHFFNQSHLAALRSGAINLTDLDQLHRYLIFELLHTEAVSSFVFGDPQGNFRLIHRLSVEDIGSNTNVTAGDLPFEVGIAREEDPATLRIYTIDEQGQVDRNVEVIKNVDVRDRPWYQAAVKAGESGWTEPFQIGRSNRLTLSAYAPLYNDTQQLQGVFSVNISLQKINEFLEKLPISEHGQVFIIERDGSMIANSIGEPVYVSRPRSPHPHQPLPFVTEPGKIEFQRLSADESENAVMRAVAQHLAVSLHGMKKITPSAIRTLKVKHDRYFLRAVPYSDSYGLDWLIVTVVPQSTFLADIQANRSRTIWICGFALVTSIAIGITTARWVSRPLRQLSQASQDLAKGNRTPPIPARLGISEVEVMARSFAQMADQIRQSFEQTEIALKESEAQYATIFRNSPDPISITSLANGRWVDVNESFLQLTGYQREEVIDRTAEELNVIVYPEETTAIATQLEATGYAINQELHWRTKTGEIKVSLVSCEIISLQGQPYVLGISKDISELKQIQTALQTSETRLRLALEISQAIAWERDLKTNTISFTSTVPALTPQTVSYEEALSLVHPDDRDAVHQANETAITQVGTFQIEHRVAISAPASPAEASQWRWFQVSAKVLTDADGQPTHLIGMSVDITDHKRMELSLQETNDRQQAILSVMPDLMFVVNANGRVLEQITIKPDLDLYQGNPPLPRSIYDCDIPALSECKANAIQTALTTGTIVIYEQVIEHNQKSQFEEVRCVPMPGERALILVRDITDRKQTELALQKSETRFRAISDASPANIYILVRRVDASFYFEHLSRAIETIYERPAAELLTDASLLLDRIHPDDRAGYEAAAQRSLVTLEPFQHEWRIFGPYGQIKWLRGSSQPKQRDNGEVAWYGVVLDITERKEIELALQAKTEELDRFFSVALDLLCIANTDGYFLRLNPQWQRTLGYDLRELAGTKFLDYVHPDDLESTLGTIDHLKTQNEIPFFVNRYRCRDGSYRWLEWRSFPVGHLIYAAARDVTDRKNTEDQLRIYQERLDSILNSIDSAIWSTSYPDFVTLYASPGVEKIYQRSVIEFIENPNLWLDVVHPDDQPQCLELLPRLLAQASFSVEKRIIRPSGEIRWVLDRGWVVHDEAGQPIRVDGIATDITDLKEAQTQIQLYKDRLDSILNSIDSAIWSTTYPDHTTLYASPGVEKIYQRSIADFQANSTLWLEVIHPDDQPQILSLLPQLATQGRLELEKRIFRPNGEMRWVLERCWLVYDRNGQAIRVDGIATDITDRKQAELELQAAKAAAEAASQAKSLFLANMSHELRTPLNAILGFTQLLARDAQLSPQHHEQIQIIHRNGEHLLSLINDILDLSKIEADRVQIHLTAVDLNHLLTTLAQTFAPQAQAKGLNLSFSIVPEVPTTIVTDPQKLNQILLNLLSNAIKFTAEGDVQLSIESASITAPILREGCTEEPSKQPIFPNSSAAPSPKQPTLAFTIKDTGAGIASEELPVIFDVFTQAQAGRKSMQGTGLGLSISRKLAHLLGGEIQVSSTLGQGSTFQLLLPYQPTAATTAHDRAHPIHFQLAPETNGAAIGLQAEDLAMMPAAWLMDLYQAALYGDEDAIATLTQTLPADTAPLADRIARLAYDYEFEQIKQAAEACLQVTHPSGVDEWGWMSGMDEV